MQLNTIEEAIRATQSGEIVIIVDDEDRENEGDLVMAAENAHEQKIAFMVRHTSGIICAPLMRAHAETLQLNPMVQHNDAPLETAFTVTVDYRKGLTTGISAKERSATIRALADEKITAQDFVRPGHVFPLIARDGGVLMRSGHTEAAVDLARLAGLSPVGVIGELVNDDGSVKKGQQLFDFAVEHGLLIISIEDLISYRQQRESLISRVSEGEVQTKIGKAKAIIYQSQFDDYMHIALIYGKITPNMPVRLQREDILHDIFATDNNIEKSMLRIQKQGSGVIIYLRGYQQQYVLADLESDHEMMDKSWREIGLGAQILRDLGLKQISLLASQERQYVGLNGFGIEVEQTIYL